MADLSTVVVGGGPAGVRAAATLAAHGLPVVLIDESPRPGGQIYRQPPDALDPAYAARYGFEARKARALHQAAGGFSGAVDHRPSTLAWNVRERTLDLLRDGRLERLAFDCLVLATGAT